MKRMNDWILERVIRYASEKEEAPMDIEVNEGLSNSVKNEKRIYLILSHMIQDSQMQNLPILFHKFA